MRVKGGAPCFVSVFAGRIADTGRDPVPLMAEAVKRLQSRAQHRADLGEPARAAEHLPGRRDRLPRHHRDQRHPQEAVAGRQGHGRVFARDREDVLRGRQGRGLQALMRRLPYFGSIQSIIAHVRPVAMGRLGKFYPYAILGVALALFVYPLLFGRTLTQFSDIYALWPGYRHRPPGWFHSAAIDATPIFLFYPSDLLNRALLRAGELFSWNPFVGFGTPWLGAMQGAPYFPGKLISMFWPDYWRGQDLMLIALLMTAGIGNYLLLRSMGVGPCRRDLCRSRLHAVPAAVPDHQHAGIHGRMPAAGHALCRASDGQAQKRRVFAAGGSHWRLPISGRISRNVVHTRPDRRRILSLVDDRGLPQRRTLAARVSCWHR